jgi:hypothetical protein
MISHHTLVHHTQRFLCVGPQKISLALGADSDVSGDTDGCLVLTRVWLTTGWGCAVHVCVLR